MQLNSNSRAWNEEEQRKLIGVLKEHGRDWKKVLPLFENRNRAQVTSMVYILMKKFQKNSELPGADLLSTLTPRSMKARWTKDELEKLFEGLRKFGKDWQKIADYVGSRDAISTRL